MNRLFWFVGRLLQMIPTLVLIGLVVFVLVHMLPGDIVTAMLGDHATPQAVANMRAALGLDHSLAEQFVLFLRQAIHMDFGMSLANGIPVATLIAQRLPVTLLMTAMAVVIAIILAVPLAFVAALRAEKASDVTIRAAFQVGLSSPVFYVGIVLLSFFAAKLRWFPVGGYGNGFFDHLYHLILPAFALAVSLAAILMRNLRAAILAVIRAEYVDFARAKGIPARLVLFRHVLRNALIATVTLLGLSIGSLLGGAVITETVFAVPGVGRLMVDSIFARDYPVIEALTLVLAVIVSLTFLATDIVQMALDPRIGR